MGKMKDQEHQSARDEEEGARLHTKCLRLLATAEGPVLLHDGIVRVVDGHAVGGGDGIEPDATEGYICGSPRQAGVGVPRAPRPRG